MIPLYGFLEGDTLGMLILVGENALVAEIADRMRQSARVRVACAAHLCVVHNGQLLNNTHTIGHVGIEALDRVDVRIDRSIPREFE